MISGGMSRGIFSSRREDVETERASVGPSGSHGRDDDVAAIFQKRLKGREQKSLSMVIFVRDLRASRSGRGPWKEERKEASINSIIRK